MLNTYLLSNMNSQNIINYEYRDCENFYVETIEYFNFDIREKLSKYMDTFDTENNKFYQEPLAWRNRSESQKQSFIMHLSDMLEHISSKQRQTALKCIIYLLLDARCSKEDVMTDGLSALWNNCRLLYELDIFSITSELLHLEFKQFMLYGESNLKYVIDVLYLFTELFRIVDVNNSIRQQFILDLTTPMNDRLLMVSILEMITTCSQNVSLCKLFPFKKAFAYLWKLSLISFGGLLEIKQKKREAIKKYETINENDTTNVNTPLKAKKDDIKTFLNSSRLKYFGYTMNDRDIKYEDANLRVGFPETVQKNIDILTRHQRIGLGDIQTQKEEHITNHPNTAPEDIIINHAVENFYRLAVFKLPQFIKSVLEQLQFLQKQFDFYPNEYYQANCDLLAKSITGFLIVCIKNFKLNHIYQYEYLSQILYWNNCIPIILNFMRKNSGTLEATAYLDGIPFYENVDTQQQASWRRMFIYTNFAKILVQLSKDKVGRINKLKPSLSILVNFRNIENVTLNFYMLKLMKMILKSSPLTKKERNCKYMDIVSSIYKGVPAGFNDNWLINNTSTSNPKKLSDVHKISDDLHNAITTFNRRRYLTIDSNDDIESCTSNIYLPRGFKKNYEAWLDEEVHNKTIDWEGLFLNNVI